MFCFYAVLMSITLNARWTITNIGNGLHIVKYYIPKITLWHYFQKDFPRMSFLFKWFSLSRFSLQTANRANLYLPLMQNSSILVVQWFILLSSITNGMFNTCTSCRMAKFIKKMIFSKVFYFWRSLVFFVLYLTAEGG